MTGEWPVSTYESVVSPLVPQILPKVGIFIIGSGDEGLVGRVFLAHCLGRAGGLRCQQGLGNLGLDVHITEMDVRVRLPATNASLVQQADVYESILRACLAESACGALITWGFTDKYSWVPSFFTGYGAALPFDENYQPKLAYDVMLAALAN